MDWEPSDASKTMAWVVLASIAGLLGYLMRTVETGAKVRWARASLEALTSGFIGYLAIQLCRATGLSYEWTGVVVGLFGWLGASASVKLLEKVVRKKLGIEESQEPK